MRREVGQHAFRVRAAINSDRKFHRISFQVLDFSIASSVRSNFVEDQEYGLSTRWKMPVVGARALLKKPATSTEGVRRSVWPV